MNPAISHHYNLPIRQAISTLPKLNSMPLSGSTTNWAELVTPLIETFYSHVRWIVREEIGLLSDEVAIEAAAAEKNDQLITVQQAADVMGMRPQTVYEWIKAGKLPSFTIGGRSIRLKRCDVLAALQANSQPDGRRKYARRTNSAAKQKHNSVLGASPCRK